MWLVMLKKTESNRDLRAEISQVGQRQQTLNVYTGVSPKGDECPVNC